MNKGILVILDGYGEGKDEKYNAVKNAKTPTLDFIKSHSYSLLRTDGECVGLLDGDMGGSEVGHMTIGAGRVVPTMAKLLQDQIKSGDFGKNKEFTKMLNMLEENKSDLHLIGLASDKNIHSNINHAIEIVRYAKDKAKNIFFHFVTDGRDTAGYDSLKYLKLLKKELKHINNFHILSVSGRFYSMDRENVQDRTDLAFNAMFEKIGINQSDIEKHIKSEHSKGNNDQFIVPKHIEVNEFAGIKPTDYVLFYNFREDRLRQIVKKCESLNCKLITMANVGGVKATPLYRSTNVKNTLSEFLSKNGMSQIKIGETTKYAHITYFLNGGEEKPFPGEDRVHVPTFEVDDFSKKPKMRAKQITNEVVKATQKGYDAIIVNYSNPDMVGHTGNYTATVKALEFLDKCIKKIVKQAHKENYFLLITADHGNAEEMKMKNGEPNLAHTLNPVFCAVVGPKCKIERRGSLIDVAPTFIDLMGMKKNKHFEGESLIEKIDN